MERKYELTIRTDDNMPDGLGGMINRFEGNRIVITVNGNDGKTEQAANFLHEAMHLWRDDFTHTDRAVSELEAETDADLVEVARFILSHT